MVMLLPNMGMRTLDRNEAHILDFCMSLQLISTCFVCVCDFLIGKSWSGRSAGGLRTAW